MRRGRERGAEARSTVPRRSHFDTHTPQTLHDYGKALWDGEPRKPRPRDVEVPADAAVIAHSEALLDGDELSCIVSADIFQPAPVLDHPTVRAHLDFSRPMAMWQVGTLHHYTGDDGADLMRLEAFLPGLEIVPPGPGRPGELEPCDLWWPDGPKLRPLNQVERRIAAAIGGKP